MRKKIYRRQNRTLSNKRNKSIKKSIKRSKRNKTGKKRIRGGTTPRTRSRSRSQSPNRSTNTSSPPQSTLSKITDMFHNTFLPTPGQYRKNGQMLWTDGTIVGDANRYNNSKN